MGWNRMPIHGRRQRLALRRAWSMIGRAMSMGIAKPMPDESVATAVLMPDDRARGVDQRPAGVARVDRRVGLDEVVDPLAVVDRDVAALAGHDAAGHGERVGAERAADGDDELADLEAVAIADRGDRAGRSRRP